MNKNIILFQKLQKIICDKKIEKNDNYVMSFNSDLLQLGYCLSKSAFEFLATNSINKIIEIHSDLIPFIKKSIGVDKNFKSFYKNFPQEVMELSDFELWMNATLHYWSEGKWEPADQFIERGFAIEKTNFKIIDLATEDEFSNILTTLLSANGSITQTDKTIVEWFFEKYQNLKIPDSIPFKETLCMVAVLGSKRNISVPVKTVTDVLRIATYMSNGDISLPTIPKQPNQNFTGWRWEEKVKSLKIEREKFKFKKFPRSIRRYLLSLLENCISLSNEDMYRHRGRWLRLGEILHPGEYQIQFPKTANVFQKIRNEKVITFGSKIETALKNKNLNTVLKLLSSRPGEFARRLDDLLRDFVSDQKQILDNFSLITQKISTSVLLQLHGHFKERSYIDEIKKRSIMIKGRKSKKFVIEKYIPGISVLTSESVKNIISNTLCNKFLNLPQLGKVWIAPELYKMPIPFAMRSANFSLKTLVRGTRISFGDYKVLRAFIHWNDKKGQEDIDLSSMFLDENFNPVSGRKDYYNDGSVLSFRNLKIPNFNSCHSGDVRMRKGPCAEYVDIDIKKCLDSGVKYVVIDIRNFQKRPLHTLDQCIFGWMGRDFPESDEHFIPKTIQNTLSLMNESTSVYAIAIDLKELEIIWLDIESNGIVLNTNSKEAQSITNLINIVNSKMTTGELLELHVKSRGTLVNTKEEAQIVFDSNLLYNYDKILSEYI